MNKKIIRISLLSIMIFSLIVGCNKSKFNDNTNSNNVDIDQNNVTELANDNLKMSGIIQNDTEYFNDKICNFCNKSFSSVSSKNKHIKKNCKFAISSRKKKDKFALLEYI